MNRSTTAATVKSGICVWPAHNSSLYHCRKRRDHIKGSFTTLRDQVPQLAGEKASRSLILTAARDFISQVQTSNSTLEVEVWKGECLCTTNCGGGG